MYIYHKQAELSLKQLYIFKFKQNIKRNKLLKLHTRKLKAFNEFNQAKCAAFMSFRRAFTSAAFKEIYNKTIHKLRIT